MNEKPSCRRDELKPYHRYVVHEAVAGQRNREREDGGGHGIQNELPVSRCKGAKA
jgi:hypothetical protein